MRPSICGAARRTDHHCRLLQRLALLAAATGALPTTATGQAADDSEFDRFDCFRGRPAPRCRSFWLTEVGVYARVAGTGFTSRITPEPSARHHLGTHVTWEVGGMANRGTDRAVGATLLLGAGLNDGVRVGFKGRYRRWLGSSGATLDLSAGPLRTEVQVPYPRSAAPALGLTGDVTLGWKELAAVTVRGEVLRTNDHRTVAAVYGGGRLGSYPALVTTAAGAVVVAVLAAAVMGMGDY
jgi:hypothetical protein